MSGLEIQYVVFHTSNTMFNDELKKRITAFAGVLDVILIIVWLWNSWYIVLCITATFYTMY